jgi:hypothetical protein
MKIGLWVLVGVAVAFLAFLGLAVVLASIDARMEAAEAEAQRARRHLGRVGD